MTDGPAATSSSDDPAALFGFDPPELDDDRVRRILADHWGLTGDLRRLRGERSHNTRIGRPTEAWILQVQSASEDPAAIDLRTQALVHLEATSPDVPVSRVVRTVDGSVHAEVEVAGRTHLARLVTYLPGVTFDPSEALPHDAYRRIGELIGSIAAGLDGFEHPAARHFMPWDIANGLVVEPRLRAGATPAARDAVAAVDERLHRVLETMQRLPRRTIHNDGHAGNLIRPDGASSQVSGVIDFGDLVHTVTAADVAIIAESFAPDHADPSTVVAAVAAGYVRRIPLGEDEIGALPELVLARTALNVLLADHQVRHAPHLAPGAAAAMPDVIDRLRRWSRIDVAAMIARTHEEIDRDRSARSGEEPR
jgi:hydroxylysine kinase